ncbi:MAG: amidophosphoribosyltransferase [Gammaproteobacteria bacterium]|nr:amidophosphoribosyltransferase [Gammaproteobacteria bacterium]
MCGIVGIVGRSPVNQSIYDALTVLQHRGQDAAGILTWDGDRVHVHKANGLVADVFRQEHMEQLTGNAGLGHVRYPTAGSSGADEAQPFYTNSPWGISIVHNGNLINAAELKELMFKEDLRHLNTDSDSETILNVFAHGLQEHAENRHVTPESVFAAVADVHKRCIGGYAIVSMINGYGMVGYRDRWGIRPLVLGKREGEHGTEYMLASESVALDALDFDLVRDVAPGEAIIIDFDGNMHSQLCAEKTEYHPCIFEYVYFARPDSIIDGISVYKARLRMGEALAAKIMNERPDHDIDVVIPIPDTSRTSALQMAHDLGVKFREGFIKNRYIGRTFIMPGQEQRRKSVKRKLNPIDLEFRDKVVLLVDDSIVRGTTSQQIIQMARDAGARKVYFASAAPPVRFPNVYGIDMAVAQELIASERDVKEVEKLIGADWLIYQDLDDLVDAVRFRDKEPRQFDTSCFSGEYVTGGVDEAYFQHLRELRSDEAKSEREKQRAKAS